MSLINLQPPAANSKPRNPRSIAVPFLRQAVPSGDFVAGITTAIGVKPCAPCKQRQAAMNQRFVFRPWGQR